MTHVERDVGGGTGSARRQRERRLRSFLRHERMAVALHLAEALHHSSGASLEPVVERREEEVEAEVLYDALRGQEQPPPGMRPGSLSDPGVAAWAPRLTPVVLVQEAALDDKTVAWLLERSLAERQLEEEALEAASGAPAGAGGWDPYLSSDVGCALPYGAACRGVVLGQGRVGQEEGAEEVEEEE